jgi:hypothetical protein
MSIATAQESNRSGHHGRDKTSPENEAPVPGGIITQPPRLRRRPALVAASVAAICLGALLAVWAYTGASTSQNVLAVRTTVHRGELITAEDVTSAGIPAKGMSLVGVSLPPALLPAAQLQSGDQVRIVATPGAQGDLATGTSPTSIGATVVGVRGAGDNGQIVVDVSVPYDQAAELAARAATGKIALVLDSRER